MSDDLVKRLRIQIAHHALSQTTVIEAADRIEQLEAALQSIAANTCCDKCQEAALVARAVLAGEKKDD